MPIGLNYAVALSLGLLVASAAHAQATGPDIVVKASPAPVAVAKKGTWRRAEADHVVVTSNGSEAELLRVTTALERLHQLMSRLYRGGDDGDEAVKLQVILLGSSDFYAKMGLRNLRAEEGPFARSFASERYYDPRDDGEILAVARTDQMIRLDTTLAASQDCEDAMAAGAPDCSGLPYHPPMARDWETVLYSAFAEHFLRTYVPAPYPRWYLDGVGALFSTIDVRRDGTLDYARAPLDYKGVFRSYGALRVGDVLTGRYLAAPSTGMVWTPYHAWLLAHYFLFADLKPERSRQFADYMAAIRQGVPMAEAARGFGDKLRLQREVERYAACPTWFARADPPAIPVQDPRITLLAEDAGIAIEAKLALGAGMDASVRAADPAWLVALRASVIRLPHDGEAMLILAEAECRIGHADACLAAAERVLAKSPDDVRALAWKGIAQTDRAIAGPAADRSAGLTAARATIGRATALDGRAPLPAIAWFQSFTKAGEPVPEQGLMAMANVIRQIPAAPGPRLYLGEELVRQGKADLARRLLHPMLLGSDGSPEKAKAEILLATSIGEAGRQDGGAHRRDAAAGNLW
jgi:hypothetical protein